MNTVNIPGTQFRGYINILQPFALALLWQFMYTINLWLYMYLQIQNSLFSYYLYIKCSTKFLSMFPVYRMGGLELDKPVYSSNQRDKIEIFFNNFFSQALQSAASVLQSGAERLRKSHAEINIKNDFHMELLNVRQKWRLKKTGTSILGDLSYRSGQVSL